MKKYMAFMFIMCLMLSACTKSKKEDAAKKKQADEALLQNALTYFKALPEVAENPANPITDAKVKLGQLLYHEKALSLDNTISCNSCHDLAKFGVDNLPTSPGVGGTLGTRNSPTVFNAALDFVQFWDGREPDVEAQAGGPIVNPVEMAMPDQKAVVERLKKNEKYVALFTEAFPGEKDPVTYENLKKAIGAFERLLLTPSRFDAYLNGDLATLTDKEKKGMQSFIESGCITCHVGANLGGTMFHKFGLFKGYWEETNTKIIDQGKFDVTKNETDRFFFKVSGLRNIEKTAPYFHDGSVNDLGEAIKVMSVLQLNKELDEQKTADILAFLKALNGTPPAKLIKVPEL